MQVDPLSQLFDRYLSSGDVSALGQVFDRAAPELLKVARHLCGDEAEAEDALQAAFQTAIEKRDSWDRERPFLPWMVGVLNLHAKKARAKAERRIESERLEERTVADPAELVADRELGHIVRQRIQRLPELYAQAVHSYLLEGTPTRELAERLGITPNAASVRLHRGLRLLQRALPAGASSSAIGILLPKAEARGIDSLRGELLEFGREGSGLATTTSSVSDSVASSSSPNGSASAGGSTGSTAGDALSSVGRSSSGRVRGASASGSKAVGSSGLAGALGLGSIATKWGAASLAAVAIVATVWNWPGADGDEETLSAARPLVPSPAPSDEAPVDQPSATRATSSIANDVQREEPVVAPAPTGEVTPDVVAAVDPEEWLRRFVEARDWRAALAVAYELAKLPEDDALAVMQAIFQRIPNEQYRGQILKPFVFDGGHVHALAILHLAATDPSLDVQGRAFVYLKSYAFRDFSTNYDAYLAWYARYAGRPLADVLRANAVELVVRLGAARGESLESALAELERLDLSAGEGAGVDLAAELRDAGLLDLADDWLANGSPSVQQVALTWLAKLDAPEAWLRSIVLPMVAPGSEVERGTFSRACTVLGQPGRTWAIQPLVEAFRLAAAQDRPTLYGPMRALAEIGDASVIPLMIGMIQADPELHYSVGYFGLSRLTGVTYDESHGAAFWLSWWENNRGRLPAEVTQRGIPSVSFPN